MNTKKTCWCCIAATEDYIIGCKRLKERMEYLGSKYPVEILITSNIIDAAKNLLRDNEFRVIPYLEFDNTNRYKTTINKIACWSLIDYDYVCFIETDVFILNNIDYIIDSNAALLKVKQILFTSKSELENNKLSFGTFIILLKPNINIYNELYNGYLTSKNKFELDDIFFGAFFKDKFNSVSIIHNISQLNNDIIHIMGPIKPWHFNNPNWILKLFNESTEYYNWYIDNNYLLLLLYSKLLGLLCLFEIPSKKFELLDLSLDISKLLIKHIEKK